MTNMFVSKEQWEMTMECLEESSLVWNRFSKEYPYDADVVKRATMEWCINKGLWSIDKDEARWLDPMINFHIPKDKWSVFHRIKNTIIRMLLPISGWIILAFSLIHMFTHSMFGI